MEPDTRTESAPSKRGTRRKSWRREKPNLGELTTRSRRYIARKTVREFIDDECPDLAAALTYYSVLGLLPAALALVSLLGLIDQARASVDTALRILAPLMSDDMVDSVRPAMVELATNQSAGLTLIVALVVALWSSSAYVHAFSRAMNRVYEIEEGRPFWKLRPQMIVVTLVLVLLCAAVLLILIVSEPVAQVIGGLVGLGDTAVAVWGIVKWPALALVVMLVVGILYYTTPNVQQPRFRWISPGAFLAIFTWVLASVGFAIYVAYFARYDATYGSLGGIVVFLLWLWLTNLALLFGAELDAEIERGRELQAGIAAEEEIQLPLRDERGIHKAADRHAEAVRLGRVIRDNARKKWEQLRATVGR